MEIKSGRHSGYLMLYPMVWVLMHRRTKDRKEEQRTERRGLIANHHPSPSSAPPDAGEDPAVSGTRGTHDGLRQQPRRRREAERTHQPDGAGVPRRRPFVCNGIRFRCRKCGFEAHADVVGALNISLAISGLAEAA
ncbi:MAG: transposase [Brockia lithotrophica]|nr:transposase [Brockia lithotrophica]